MRFVWDRGDKKNAISPVVGFCFWFLEKMSTALFCCCVRCAVFSLATRAVGCWLGGGNYPWLENLTKQRELDQTLSLLHTRITYCTEDYCNMADEEPSSGFSFLSQPTEVPKMQQNGASVGRHS